MLPQTFFSKDALSLAPALLGCELVHETDKGVVSGIIVETECYNQTDAASHSYRGQTERTKVMFGPGGYAYIYFTYGMHYCFNVVAGREGFGEAVLIRALEPTAGIELMQKHRGKNDQKQLTSGPAKLVQALGITKADYGKPLFEGNLNIRSGSSDNLNIISGPRIGIKQAVDKPWRFWISNNPYVSKK